MTLPREEKVALEMTRTFLRSLLYPSATPKVPKKIREEARRCLRHYPYQCHIDTMYKERMAKCDY